ncbi:MAG TPA: transporter [Patescibacteria group bacterium]|nr:transporter [Patescibacteria group bacterium]
MLKKTVAGALLVGTFFAAGQASATELWDNHLRGVDTGLAAGALPPQGVYFVDDNYMLSYKGYASNKETSTKLDGLVNVPIVLWNPGLHFLGGDYAVAVAQPFDYTSIGTGGNQSAHTGTFNTILVPAIMSWALPYDLHVKGSVAVFLNDASSSQNAQNRPEGGVGAGNAFTTFEPGLGVSWLHDGWNLSAQMQYDTSTKDNSSVNAPNNGSYQSGDQFSVDYTATKTINKWTVGLGGFQQNQLQRDKIGGVSTAGTVGDAYGAGPIVGYQFGGVNVQAQYTHDLLVHNDVGGDTFNVRFVVPLL